MWTSHQPFVIPIDIRNFEDPSFTKPKQSVAIQEKENILAPIDSEITAELSSPHFKTIFEKFTKLETNNPTKTLDEKTVTLFKSLTEDEKKYLESRHAIQKNKADKPFAVTWAFYKSLLLDKGIQNDTE
jgi:hypothetical protein